MAPFDEQLDWNSSDDEEKASPKRNPKATRTGLDDGNNRRGHVVLTAITWLIIFSFVTDIHAVNSRRMFSALSTMETVKNVTAWDDDDTELPNDDALIASRTVIASRLGKKSNVQQKLPAWDDDDTVMPEDQDLLASITKQSLQAQQNSTWRDDYLKGDTRGEPDPWHGDLPHRDDQNHTGSIGSLAAE